MLLDGPPGRRKIARFDLMRGLKGWGRANQYCSRLHFRLISGQNCVTIRKETAL